MLKVFRHFVAMTLDIKNAYLMAVQTEDGKAYVEVDGKVYSACQDNEQQHRSGFTGAAKEFGMEQGVMQPTLLMTQGGLHHSPCGRCLHGGRRECPEGICRLLDGEKILPEEGIQVGVPFFFLAPFSA